MRKLYFSFLLLFFAFSQLQAQNVNVTATAGTPNGSYLTLKDAFDAINAGTHQGVITVNIAASTVEGATAFLNGSGTGASFYSSILIKPTTLATISGSIAGPLIDLNGADNVTIDGRIGAAGTNRSLTIQNLSTTNSANTSTVRFINDAQSNTLNYLNLEGAAPLGALGVGATILIDSSTVATGNRNITISNNDIGPAGGTTPTVAIYSRGESATLSNSAITVSNNSIHDFFSPTGLSSAIALDPFTTSWTITGNSFYQTAPRASTGNITHYIVNIYDGSGYTISNNYIGGSGAFAGSSPYTIAGGFNNYVVPIYLRVGTGSNTNVDGNTITNLNITSTPAASAFIFSAVRATSGNVNLGVTSGNTIGALAGTGSITINPVGINANFSQAILTSTTGALDIRNNIVGSITYGAGGTGTANFWIVETDATPSAFNFQGNSIGGTSVNSIQSNAASSAMLAIVNFQTSTTNYTISSNTIRNLTNNGTVSASIVGIQNQVLNSNINATNTITGNTISNLLSSSSGATTGSVSGIITTQSGALTNATANGNINNNQINNLQSNSTGTASLVRGIVNANPFPGFLNINNNIIHSLTSASPATTSTTSGATAGISQGNTFASITGPCTISANVIYNLENTSSTAATHVIGIGLSYGSGEGNITQNRIYNLRNPNAPSTGLISGMVLRGISSAGIFNVSNNMMSLTPANVQTYGIHNNLAASQIISYHNSVYIGGTAASTNNSASFFRNGVATAVNLRNNILYNIRTGGGSHYAVSNTNSTPSSGWISDYNDLYITNPATVALWGAANNDLATYKTNSGDANSKSFVVNFLDPTNGDLHLTGASVGDVNLKGTNTTGITIDFDGQTRGNTPYIGADEVITAFLPVEVEFFTGRKQNTMNLLAWKASCTSNSITFEIERSTDGRRFSTVGKITASQARCEQPFDYTDASPAPGMNYYRLKMTEADGALKYSAIIAILNKSTGFELVGLYPTLIQSKATLSITAAKKTSLQIFITDANGRTMQQRSMPVAEGSALLNLDLSGLAGGVYHLTGTTPEGYTKTIRFVKQ